MRGKQGGASALGLWLERTSARENRDELWRKRKVTKMFIVVRKFSKRKTKNGQWKLSIVHWLFQWITNYCLLVNKLIIKRPCYARLVRAYRRERWLWLQYLHGAKRWSPFSVRKKKTARLHWSQSFIIIQCNCPLKEFVFCGCSIHRAAAKWKRLSLHAN